MEVNGELCDKYTVKKKLGKGSYGDVFLIEDESGNPFAFKLIKNDKWGMESLNEVNILLSLEHPNILLGKQIYNEKNCEDVKNKVGIVVALSSMSLATYIDRRQPYRYRSNYKDNIIKVVKDIIRGVRALHDFNILHLDLKPDNILVKLDNSGNVINAVVSDMGSCIYLDNVNEERILNYSIGSPLYKPYERLVYKACDIYTDVYSLGFSFVECFDGDIFEDLIITNNQIDASKILKITSDRNELKRIVDAIISPYFQNVPDEFNLYSNLFTDCLLVKSRRISLDQCFERLNLEKIPAIIKSYYIGKETKMYPKIKSLATEYIKKFKNKTFMEHLTLTIDMMYLHLTNFRLKSYPNSNTMINTYSLIAFKVLNRDIIKNDNMNTIFYDDMDIEDVKNFELLVVKDLRGILNSDRPYYFSNIDHEEILEKMKDPEEYSIFFNDVLSSNIFE